MKRLKIRWNAATSKSTGRSEATSAAAAVGQSSSRSNVKKSLIATGTGLTAPDVSTSGMRRKVQSITNQTDAEAARTATAIARAVAHAADTVLVTSSSQNPGSATPTSEKCSNVSGPLHDGGWVELSGSTPTEASAVHTSGRRNPAPARKRTAERRRPGRSGGIRLMPCGTGWEA